MRIERQKWPSSRSASFSTQASGGPIGRTPRWTEIREMVLRAEAMGFDTVWTPDELLWRVKGRAATGGGTVCRWPAPWPR